MLLKTPQMASIFVEWLLTLGEHFIENLTWTMPLRTTETMSVVLFCPYFLHSLKKTYHSNDSVVLRWFQRSNLCILSQTCTVNYSQRDYHKEFCRRCASVHNQDIQKQLFYLGTWIIQSGEKMLRLSIWLTNTFRELRKSHGNVEMHFWQLRYLIAHTTK